LIQRLTVFRSSVHCGHNFIPRSSFSTLNFRVQNSHSYQIQPMPVTLSAIFMSTSFFVSGGFVNQAAL
jgi:hypothetical protein